MAVSPFIGFLVAGLAILAILLAVFSLSEFSFSTVRVPINVTRTTNLSAAMLVGPENVDVSKLFLQDFRISSMKDTHVYNTTSKTVFNGLLFGSDMIKYDINANNVENLDIKFDIVKTNGYAPLIIKVNGIVVSNKVYNLGQFTVSVDSSLISDYMTIEISAESSSWRIWAPTLYELANVQFVVKSIASSSDEFTFSIPQEMIDSFSGGRIDIALSENIGVLIAELNGKKLHEDTLLDAKTLKFNKSDIRLDNTLVMSAGESSQFYGMTKILVFYTTALENTALIPFNMSATDMDALGTGEVSFDIVDVSSSGGFALKIKGNQTTRMTKYGTAEIGRYKYSFDNTSVIEGLNVISIESLDNAVFHVDDVEVKIMP